MTTHHGHLDLLGELRFNGDAGTAGLVALSGGAGATPSYGLVGSVALEDLAVVASKIANDAVGLDALDLSISPTWTGAHTFSGAASFQGGVTVGGTGWGDALMFEGGNHGISVHDGFANFALRVGNYVTPGVGEFIAESNEYAFKTQWEQNTGDLVWRISQDGLAGDAVTWQDSLRIDHSATELRVYGSKVWTQTNDGDGSGLVADMLDGYHASEFPRIAQNATIDGAWTFNSSIALGDGLTVDGRDVSADGAKLDLLDTWAAAAFFFEEIDAVTSPGWYTIAYTTSNRASARFEIQDRTGGHHGTTTFYASAHYGEGETINVINSSEYGTQRFDGLRIKTAGTYDGALLQVNVGSGSGWCFAWVRENTQSSGWNLCDWIADGVDPSSGAWSGFATVDAAAAQAEVDLTQGKISNTHALHFASKLYIGGLTTQYEALHLGNIGTATILTSQLSGTIDADTLGGLSALTQPGQTASVVARDANGRTQISDLIVGNGGLSDLADAAPWYGIGMSSLDGHNGNPDAVVQVAGYYGLRLRSSAVIVDIGGDVAGINGLDITASAGVDISDALTIGGAFAASSATYQDHTIYRDTATGNATLQFGNQTNHVYIGVGDADGKLHVGAGADVRGSGHEVYHEGNIDAATILTSQLSGTIGNTGLADMAEGTIKGRGNGVGSGDPQDLGPGSVQSIIKTGNGWIGEAEIATNAVGTDQLDLTIAPTWTGLHRFDGSLIVDTNTNAAPLYVTRHGTTIAEYVSIGVTDRAVDFRYIEDTASEGSGNFGAYRFYLGGNDGESEELALFVNHSKLNYMGYSIVDGTSGGIFDGRITQSSVTQHEAALTIDASQLVGTIASARIGDDSLGPEKLNLDVAADGRDFDASALGEFWGQRHDTSGSDGTWPSNYVWGVNLGGYASRGIQLAAQYGSNEVLWFRRGSDNSGSPNGAHAWQPWHEIAHTGSTGVVSTAMLANDAVDVDKIDLTMAPTWTGNHTFDGGLTIGAGEAVVHNSTSSRAKYQLGSSSTHAIGFQGNFTYGDLGNDYAITFQTNADDRGFWFGKETHSQDQGAMAVTTDGRATINQGLQIGYGSSNPGKWLGLDYGSTHSFWAAVGGGALETSGNPDTGAIAISLPTGAASSNAMISFWVDVYDYSTYKAFSVYVGGYCYVGTGAGPYWVNPTATILAHRGAATSRNFTVRFTHSTTQPIVYIGELTDTWNYLKVQVRDLHVGLSGTAEQFRDDWSIGFEATAFESEGGTQTLTDNFVLGYIESSSQLATGVVGSAALADDAIGAAAIDLSASYAWTGTHSFGAGLDVTGAITVSGTVDGRHLFEDGAKLDGIEPFATTDQTGAEIVTALGSETLWVTTAMLGADCVTASKIANDAVNATHYEPDSVQFAALDSRDDVGGVFPTSDTRALGFRLPQDYQSKAVSFEFTDDDPIGAVWGTAITVKGWTDAYRAWQLWSSAEADDDAEREHLFFRTGRSATWDTLRKVWDSGNLSDLTTALAGESAWLPTGLLTGTISSSQIASLDAAKLTGTLGDGLVPESAVTQHEAALEINVRQLEAWTLSTPTGFPNAPEILPVQLPDGRYTGSVSAKSLRPTITGTTYYVDVALGSDSNAGTTEGAPFQSLWKALTQTNVGLVKVAPGIYPWDHSWKAAAIGIGTDAAYGVERWACRGGEVVLTTAHKEPTWAANGTYSHVYDSTLSIVYAVTDLGVQMPQGGYLDYVKVTSLAACAAVRGSYYVSGSSVSVNPYRKGEPDDRVLVSRQVQVVLDSSRRDTWLSDLTIVGGSLGVLRQNTTGTDGGRLIARRLRVYNVNGTGIQVKGVERTILEDCEVLSCAGDGIGYAVQATTNRTRAVEVRCTSGYHGSTATNDTTNAFTSHDDMEVVRIACVGGASRGPSFADVNGDNYTWLVGCKTWASASEDEDTQESGFLFTGGAESWLHDCEGTVDRQDLYVDGSSTAHLSRCTFAATLETGTVDTYAQN